MYFWNTTALAKDFSEGKVDEKQRYFYLLGVVVIGGLCTLQSLLFAGRLPLESPLKVVIECFFQVVGIWWCFKANKKVDGSEFLDRLVAFTFANALRIYVFSLLFFLLVVFPLAGGGVWIYVKILHIQPPLTHDFFPNHPLIRDLADELLEAPFYLVWFGLVGKSIRKIGILRVA